MNNKGFIGLIASIIVSALVFTGIGIFVLNNQNNPIPKLGVQTLIIPQGGTGETDFASTSLIAGNGTDKLFSTSSPTVQSIHATSTTISSEIRGTLLVNTLNITGTCTGCAVTTDLQDAYNSSGANAQITTASNKNVIIFLDDVAVDPLFQIFSVPEGQGRLEVGTANGSATTTLGVWENYGRLGIGTTTPGSGLSVQATSTFMGGGAYIYGTTTTDSLIATSTLEIRGVTGFDLISYRGNIGIATATPGNLLQVAGQGLFKGNLYTEGTTTASSLIATSTLEVRGNSGSDLVVYRGDVGIGTSTPGDRLQVVGGGLFKGTLYAEGTTTVNALNATTTLAVASSTPGSGNAFSVVGHSVFGGNVSLTGNLDVQGTCTGCGGGSPGGTDEQVQYNNLSAFGGASALIYDDETNRVNIGTATATPTSVLTVVGNAYHTGSTTVPEITFLGEDLFDIASSTPNRRTQYANNMIHAYVHVQGATIMDHFNISSVGAAGTTITITIDQDFENVGYATVCNGYRAGPSFTMAQPTPTAAIGQGAKTHGTNQIDFFNDAGTGTTPDAYDCVFVGR